jgi:hypothetical protein
MSKRAIRIPRLRAGRRVRWTFEVSADVGGENGARAKKTSRKRQRATSPAQPVAPLLSSPVARPAAPGRRAIHLQMITVAMVMLCVVTLTLSRRPSAVEAAAADAQPERLVQPAVALVPQAVAPATASTAAAVAVAPAVPPRAVSESSAKAAALKAEKKRIAEAASPTAAVTAIDEALSKEDSTTTLAASEAISSEPVPVSPDPVGPGAVTVTGCLETNNGDRFRLTDAEGIDVARSRSWRTGFLKKQSTSVVLVDPPDTRTLKTQVGQRVAATGLLTNRELRVTSLRVIGARCD